MRERQSEQSERKKHDGQEATARGRRGSKRIERGL